MIRLKPNRSAALLPLIAFGVIGTLSLASALSPTARASTSAEVKVAKAGSEQHERDVDQVALSAQDLAISRLMGLLKKYRDNRMQEPVLLSKLADIQQQKASILFRLAHGEAHRSKKGLDFSRHRKEMGLSIQTLDRLIGKYPDFEEVAHAWYLRGKAYEEIEKKAEAGKNYLHLVHHFPNSEEVTGAYMSLAEFAIEQNDHARAIGFLKEVEKRPEDPHFPFALYKLAWCHYNLKKIPEALSFAERQIAFYNDRRSRSETEESFNAASDNALKENTLLDTAVFYFEGYEQKLGEYSVDRALDYFKKLEKGPMLGKMLLRFAKLLRSHSHESELMGWKDQVLASHSQHPEALDIVILTYEHQLNKYNYGKVVDCARDMVALYARHKGYESFPKAQKHLLDTADGLQQLVIKNKGASEVGRYSQILAQIYDSFVRVVEETDPRIPRAHYNLAETLFTIKDYVGATEHYRWVVDHGSWKAKPAAQPKGKALAKASGPGSAEGKASEMEASVADASLKAIAARYETLQGKNLIPKELAARALPKGSPSGLDPLLSEWVGWIDAHVSHSEEKTESFVFEANRALYAQGHVAAAVERMARFSSKHPESRFSVPQASLVLDTYIASADWERTHDLANEFMEVPAWKQGDFSKRLFAVASDAFYKQLELKFRARDFKAALKGCDQFLKRYAASARLSDTLALAGTAALESIDRPRAQAYLSRLIAEAPGSANVPAARLSRASILEDRYQFGPAAADYRAYLAGPRQPDADAKQVDGLRRKALALTWLSGDAAALAATLADKSVCGDQLAAECERYLILSKLQAVRGGALDEKATELAFDKARHDSSGPAANRALWATLALEGAQHLAFRDRNVAIRHAVSAWDEHDPLVKFALVPRLSASLAQAFRLNRAAMKEVAPLRAHERYIARRIEVIRELENAATKAMKLPWARIRAEVLNEVAGVYLDLARGLAALPAPKDLSSADLAAYEETIRKINMPFEEKGQDMRAKAFEIASRFAIEDESLAAIAEPFFAENPSQAKALRDAKPAEKPGEKPSLDLAFLAQLDPKGDWKDAMKANDQGTREDLAYENPALYVKTLWVRALQGRRLNQVAFFMQEAQEKALIQAGVMGAVKAVSLASAGARGEGLAELEDARRDLAAEGHDFVTTLLVGFYRGSFAREKAQTLQKELKGGKGGDGAKDLKDVKVARF